MYTPKKVKILGVCPVTGCGESQVTTEHGAYIMDAHLESGLDPALIANVSEGDVCEGSGERPLAIFHPDVERKICVNADLDGLREDGCDPRSYDLDRNTCIYCNRSLVRTFLPYEKYLAEKYPRNHGDVTDRELVAIARRMDKRS